jgi:hypothetical protein
MAYIKKAKIKSRGLGKVVNSIKFVTTGIPRIVNKRINAATRSVVNVLEEKKVLPPKTAAQMRVAIELQASKDGNQSWKDPKSKKYFLQSGTAKPSDLEDKHLTRLAKTELKRKIEETPELLDISAFGAKPKNKLYRVFPKLERIVRSLKEDALPTASREARIASRQGYDAALQKQKEELAIELMSGDRNPWIGRYSKARDSVKGNVNKVIGISAIWNASKLEEETKRQKENALNFARTLQGNTQNALKELKSRTRSAKNKIIEAPQKIKRNAQEMAANISQQISNSFVPVRKRSFQKMYTPMKSVSVPYTRTLTDDSVPSPKKYVNKMMGGKTGRMGKELTGADGVKGRYFQKSRNMNKIYEVDKPHAPQMRAMSMGGSMGMGKIQKAKLVTRMKVTPRLVTRMIPFDPTTSRTLLSTFPDKTTSGKIRTTMNAKPSYSDAEISGILRTTIVPKSSPKSDKFPSRLTIASKPPKGYSTAYTQRKLGDLKERNKSIAGNYKDFRNYASWKSQNQTPKMMREKLINAINSRGIVSSEQLFPSFPDFIYANDASNVVARRNPNRNTFRRTDVIGRDRSLSQEIARIRRAESTQARRNNPVAKRATYKMHEITDENYYGNQKPRRKDTFQKTQGAFINGRKLKY